MSRGWLYSWLWRFVSGLTLAWGVGAIIFVLSLPTEVQDTTTVTDAIVVLTGELGRVPAGVRLLAEGKAKALFISGVGTNVRLQDLSINLPKELLDRIEIGGLASDTIGNALETAQWVNAHGYKSIRLVTSYYHLPRSLREFYQVIPNLQIIPHPTFLEGNHKSWFAKTMGLLREYNKYILTYLGRIDIYILSWFWPSFPNFQRNQP